MPDMLLPFEATLKGSPYIFMAVQRKASEALKECSTAETAENAEQRILRILGELCVLRGKTSVFSWAI